MSASDKKDINTKLNALKKLINKKEPDRSDILTAAKELEKAVDNALENLAPAPTPTPEPEPTPPPDTPTDPPEGP